MDKSLSKPTTPQPLPLRGLRPEQYLGDALPAIHLVRTSWMVRLIGKFTFVLLVISLVAMFALPWQQTSRGQGTVVALNPQQRPQIVGSQQDGVVKQVRPELREGSMVKKDEPILEIEPFAPDEVNQIRSQITQLNLKLEASKNSLSLHNQIIEQTQLGGIAQLSSAEKEVEAARQKLDQQKKEVDVLTAELKQKTYEWEQVKNLFPKGLVSELEYNEKRNGWEQAQSKLKKGEAQVQEFQSTLSAKEKDLESKVNLVDIKNREAKSKAQEELGKIASTEKEISEMQVKLGSLGRLTITSPVDGLLHEIDGIEGSKTVKKGDALFTVVPQATDLAVLISVAGRDMPLVHVGDKVRLQFQGWPAVQFVGWPSVAVGTFGGIISSLSPTDDSKGNFSVLVVPDPEEPAWPDNRYLRQGVRASGWILLKRVSLGYEIWRQLNGFPPVISEQEPDKAKDKSDKGFEGKSKIKLPK